jgi:hypothetical protein
MDGIHMCFSFIGGHRMTEFHNASYALQRWSLGKKWGEHVRGFVSLWHGPGPIPNLL